MEPLTVQAVTSRFRSAPDPLTVGLSMVNWLILMLLMSGFMLAATMSDRADPAGTTSEIGRTAPR